jgi:hypothetical protein
MKLKIIHPAPRTEVIDTARIAMDRVFSASIEVGAERAARKVRLLCMLDVLHLHINHT